MKVAQLCLTLCNLTDYTVHGILQARILEWISIPFSRGYSQPRDRTQVSTLQADGLPSEPPGKPMNIGDDSLSLLQRIFLTQESNQGLLHCRWILYQLRYQGLYRKPKAEVGLFSVILLSKSTGTCKIWNTPQHYYR